MPSTEETELAALSSLRGENSSPITSSEHSASVHGQSLYLAVGQKILLDRVSAGRDFCKLMLTVSLAAIPIYLLLFILAIPYDSDVGKKVGIIVLSPSLLFLFAAIVFAAGFLLVATRPTLDFVSEIERASRKIVTRRNQFIALGSLCFVGACLLGMISIIKAHL